MSLLSCSYLSTVYFFILISERVKLTSISTVYVIFPAFQMVAALQGNIGKSCSSLGNINQRYSTGESRAATNDYISN